jgi:hypothetical protein
VPCIDGSWGGIFDVHLLFIYIQRPLNIIALYQKELFYELLGGVFIWFLRYRLLRIV